MQHLLNLAVFDLITNINIFLIIIKIKVLCITHLTETDGFHSYISFGPSFSTFFLLLYSVSFSVFLL